MNTARSDATDAPELELEHVNVVEDKKVWPAIKGTSVGNFMEWYDFGMYGYLTVTMTKVFTEGMPENVQLLVVMLGFAVSYLVRPIGGLVLGPLGDKLGRKKILFFTMTMMALATAAIGFLPTAADIGIWAVVLLYTLKLLQGFSTGGEYAGATTYVAEFSPDKRRGFFGSFLDMGSYLGFAAGATVVAVISYGCQHFIGPDGMVEWGWRIAFWTAIPVGAVAVWLRTRIPETPAFEDTDHIIDAEHADGDDFDESDRIHVRYGPVGVVRHFWRPLLIGIAIVAATNTAGYVLTSYMPIYLENEVELTTEQAALTTVPVLIVMSLSLPLIGKLSDRIGRKPVYWMGIVSCLVLMVPAFMIMHTGKFWFVVVALFMVAVPVAFFVALSASALPALFPTATRYGGMGISYNISVSLFGGTAPVVSQALLDATGISVVPALYVMLFSVICAIALLFMEETSQRPLLGSFPTVSSKKDALQLVENHEEDPRIDTSTMPIDVTDYSDSDVESHTADTQGPDSK